MLTVCRNSSINAQCRSMLINADQCWSIPIKIMSLIWNTAQGRWSVLIHIGINTTILNAIDRHWAMVKGVLSLVSLHERSIEAIAAHFSHIYSLSLFNAEFFARFCKNKGFWRTKNNTIIFRNPLPPNWKYWFLCKEVSLCGFHTGICFANKRQRFRLFSRSRSLFGPLIIWNIAVYSKWRSIQSMISWFNTTWMRRKT